MYNPWAVILEVAIWNTMGNVLFFSLALRRSYPHISIATIVLCTSYHGSKDVRAGLMCIIHMGMFPQNQRWCTPWTEVLVMFLLMLCTLCPWASLLHSKIHISNTQLIPLKTEMTLNQTSVLGGRQECKWTRTQRLQLDLYNQQALLPQFKRSWTLIC